MSSIDPALLALQRFGLGAMPGERERIGSDAKSWLAAQIDTVPPMPAALASLPSIAEAMKFMPRFLKKEFGERRNKDDDKGTATESVAGKTMADVPDGTETRYREVMRDHVLAEMQGRFDAAADSSTPFRERLVRFWANHFTVSGTKPQTLPLIGAYEREAIRPHIDGSFTDLLIATTLHPAMLTYLDNEKSIGPDSRAGIRREKGLNENLAREVLELHTLGVDGGYTQADVTAFANVLTGHGVDYAIADPDNAGYRFFPERHEPGAQIVLGRQYGQGGAEQAGAVLHDLALHPATARFVATRLVRHFISDEPPRAAVARVEKAFISSKGDLRAVHRALIEAPESWNTPLTKVRTPEEWLIASRRMLGAPRVKRPQALFGALDQLGQHAFRAPSPAGWPEESSAWLTGDSLWKRMEIALAIASRSSVDEPLKLADSTLGSLLGAATRDVLHGAESATQAVALLLVSPEFNRR